MLSAATGADRRPPGLGRRKARAACALAIALGACSEKVTAPPVFENVVDAVQRPVMEMLGLAVVPEDPDVLCRRLAVDLTGVVPTTEELDGVCRTAPREVATYFMNKPSAPHVPDGSAPYVFVNRRWWSDQFWYRTGPATPFYAYVRELDALVGDLYAGRIGYDVFAHRALASPAFVRQFGGVTSSHVDTFRLGEYSYLIFLGRRALIYERVDLGNLWRGWSARWWTSDDTRATYGDCPPAVAGSVENGCAHWELGLEGAHCEGGLRAGCRSSVFGAAEVVPAQRDFVRYAELSAADRAAIETPGRVIAGQPDFAETAVDRALARYLGWWKSGWNQPEYDLPDVRAALVRKLVRDGYDLRSLDLEIVTSVLYTQRASRGRASTRYEPYWAFGPTKVLYAEAWLDSMAQATKRVLGGCDFRYDPSLPGGFRTGTPFSASFDYAAYARDMGGCPQQMFAVHGDPAGLVPTFTRRTALGALCAGAFGFTADMTPAALVERVAAGLGRRLRDAERAALLRAVPQATSGADPQATADALCVALYDSALFTFY